MSTTSFFFSVLLVGPSVSSLFSGGWVTSGIGLARLVWEEKSGFVVLSGLGRAGTGLSWTGWSVNVGLERVWGSGHCLDLLARGQRGWVGDVLGLVCLTRTHHA